MNDVMSSVFFDSTIVHGGFLCGRDFARFPDIALRLYNEQPPLDGGLTNPLLAPTAG
jgi:hypothetical protein